MVLLRCGGEGTAVVARPVAMEMEMSLLLLGFLPERDVQVRVLDGTV